MSSKGFNISITNVKASKWTNIYKDRGKR